MGTKTGISWTDSTWNPIRGCSRVSEGCRNCYAETIAGRFSGVGLPFEGLVTVGLPGKKSTKKWNGQIKFVEEHLLDPLRWKKPRRIFVNSMSDLFHENVTRAVKVKIFAVMAMAGKHMFQVLTKRPEEMRALLLDPQFELEVAEMTLTLSCMVAGFDKPVHHPPFRMGAAAGNTVMDMPRPIGFETWPLPNVHLGVSVEDQKTADLRIPLLLQTPAAVRFISAEPLLGPVDLENLPSHSGIGRHLDSLSNAGCEEADISTKLDWVIVGGESGPGARPMHPDWARSLRDQCKAAGVPFFFKQWGAWGPLENGETTLSGYDMDLTVHTFRDDLKPRSAWEDVFLTNAKMNGCKLDGVEHHEFPAVSA